MKSIYYLSNVMSKTRLKELYVKKSKPGYQVQKFHRLLAEGLSYNNPGLKCYSVLPSSKDFLDCTFKLVKDDSFYHYAPIVNIRGIKTIFNFLYSFFSTLFRKKGDYILEPFTFDVSLGAILANKIRGNHSISILTDLPEFAIGPGIANTLMTFIIEKSDGYVFLTDEMNKKVNTNNKPWIRMEGSVDASIVPQKPAKREKTIIFAGTLNNFNGVDNLIEAFLKTKQDEYSLHFYGYGSSEESLKKICSENNNIFYHGSIPNDDLMEIMKNASLLINPRPINQEFTKYSFPSKTIEYLSTGTYSACTKLPGIPDEYFQYIGSLEDGSVQSICNFLNDFYQLKESDRELFALRGQQFVLAEKNNRVQAKSIIKLLNSL